MSQERKLIYAVDDEPSIREVYSYALQAAGFEVACFDGAGNLFATVSQRLPDLVILDIMLDGMDGYEILAKLRAEPRTADIPVIMVSAKTEEIDKVHGLNLGADDYISKPFGVLELVARINAKLRKSAHVSKILQHKDVVVDDEKHVVTVCGRETTLTLKQYELLHLLVQNAGKVVERNKLLDDVWGEDYGETRTLDMFIAELRKLLVNSACKINTVRGVGYLFD